MEVDDGYILFGTTGIFTKFRVTLIKTNREGQLYN